MIIMNKQLFYKISVSIIGIFLMIWLSAVVIYLSSHQTPLPPEQVQTPAPPSTPPQTAGFQNTPPTAQQAVTNAGLVQYQAITQNEKIAIYEIYSNGHRQLYTILENIDPKLMRTQDRERFAEGMTLYSMEEVASLIEDFSS